MCIVSNWVNEAQGFITVTKYDDLPNSLIPKMQLPEYGSWIPLLDAQMQARRYLPQSCQVN